MNISESYGGYGGVVPSTKYTPPPALEYAPQPSFIPPKSKYIPPPVPGFVPQQPTIPFTKEYREKLQILADESSPYMNVNNIMMLTRTDSLTGVTERTFTIMTSGHPDYVVTYTMPPEISAVDLARTDGGFF